MILRWQRQFVQSLFVQYSVKIKQRMEFIAQIFPKMVLYKYNISSIFSKRNDQICYYNIFKCNNNANTVFPFYNNSYRIRNNPWYKKNKWRKKLKSIDSNWKNLQEKLTKEYKLESKKKEMSIITDYKNCKLLIKKKAINLEVY